MRIIRALALAAALLIAAIPWPAAAFSDDDVSAALTKAAARRGVSRAFLRCIAGYETGWTFNPRAVGDQGMSLGLFQLHRRGLLPTFYAWGYEDPFDPYDAADFTANYISWYGARAWTPVRWGLC